MTNSRVLLFTLASLLAGLCTGMILHPARHDAALRSLRQENLLLRMQIEAHCRERDEIARALHK